MNTVIGGERMEGMNVFTSPRVRRAGVLDILASEWLKHRRTGVSWVAAGPAVLVLIFVLLGTLGPGAWGRLDPAGPWHWMLVVLYNWWPLLWTSFGTAIMAAMAMHLEERSGAWRALRVRPVSPVSLYLGKAAVLGLWNLLSALFFVALVLASGLLGAGVPVPWRTILIGAGLVWLTSLPVLVLQLWIASFGGYALAIVAGAAGMVSGAVLATGPRWLYLPWSWSLRLMSPVIGVAPNGVPMNPGDPLWNPEVIPVGIALSLAVALAAAVLGALSFGRREVR